MATINKGHTFSGGETVTAGKLNNLVDGATISNIVNAEIDAAAAIALSKLATGALPTGITVASANIVNGTIVNADINSAAAIAGGKLADGAITNAKVASNAAIAGTKISPNFGSQNITTTGFVRLNGATSGTFSAVATAVATPQLSLTNNADENNSPFIVLRKSRADGLLNDGDTLGNVAIQSHNGSTYAGGASISAVAIGAPSATSLPSGLRALTTPASSLTPQERVRIDPDGNVGINTTSPSSRLHVAGDLTVSSATTATTATAGTNGDVPAQVAGYLVVSINGTSRKIPYYAT
jgi:hypothetical protein